MSMTEVWRVIPSVPTHEVSDCGRVRSIKSGKIRKPYLHRTGALYMGFSGRRYRKVHHLVLEAFVAPKPPELECRHLNGKKDDNRLSNLAWGTHLENEADKIRHGTSQHGERNHRAKLTQKQVDETRQRRALGEKLRSLSSEFGVAVSAISRIANGVRW